jgi:hypothetical protein
MSLTLLQIPMTGQTPSHRPAEVAKFLETRNLQIPCFKGYAGVPA